MSTQVDATSLSTVVIAQQQARDRGAATVRTGHLLAALYAVPDNLARTVLTGFSVAQADVEADLDRLHDTGPSDADALATLGIDLDEVRRQIEDAFGPGALDRTWAAAGRGIRRGHIPFDPATEKVPELSLREALRLTHNYIGTQHVPLGLLHTQTGAARDILVGRGVQLEAARILVEELVRGRRAG